jgi:hypothetical protein
MRVVCHGSWRRWKRAKTSKELSGKKYRNETYKPDGPIGNTTSQNEPRPTGSGLLQYMQLQDINSLSSAPSCQTLRV